LKTTFWEQLFLQIQNTMAQQTAVPVCVMRDDHAIRILKLLCMSVGADLKNLQQDCEDVALQLFNALTPRGIPNVGSSPMSGNSAETVARASN